MGKHPHEPDVNMLLRQCDVHNVVLATNRATAELLVYAVNQEGMTEPLRRGEGPWPFTNTEPRPAWLHGA